MAVHASACGYPDARVCINTFCDEATLHTHEEIVSCDARYRSTSFSPKGAPSSSAHCTVTSSQFTPAQRTTHISTENKIANAKHIRGCYQPASFPVCTSPQRDP
eukprot:3941537-Rhodomonas_salina.11